LVTQGIAHALYYGTAVAPAPCPGRSSAASPPIEAPRGRPCRRDGEYADMSARAEISAVRTRRRVMAQGRADDRAGALWHRHCSDDRPIASSAATHSRLMARPLLS